MSTERMNAAFQAWLKRPCETGQTLPELLDPAILRIAAKGWTDGWADALATQPQAPQGAVTPGFKLVPIEPTMEMCKAALDCQDWDPKDTPESEMYCLYQAMLAAAPETPEGKK